MSILKSTHSGFRAYIYKILEQRKYLTNIGAEGTTLNEMHKVAHYFGLKTKVMT